MEKSERQILIAELRKQHETTFATLGIPLAYFAAKYPHVPEGMDEKHIGLYPSECSKGDNIYIECVDMKYKPLDAGRRLYMWKHNPDYATMYKMKKEQYLIPVSELNVVNPMHDNRIESKEESEAVRRYTKTESVEVSYREETFVGLSGARVKLTWREEELFEYTYSTERGKEPCTKLSGIELKETYEFFKQLKK